LTVEEKLQSFYDSSIDSAQSQARAMIEEHKAALDKIFDEHKETMQRQAAAELKAEKEKSKRELNKRLSAEQLGIKRTLSKKETELKNKLFREVSDKLQNFMDSQEYPVYLERKIREACTFAGSDPLVIYINSSDAQLRDQLEQKTGTKLTISEEDFKGGIRAVIKEKHILIDDSFITLLSDEKDSFIFHGGAAHE